MPSFNIRLAVRVEGQFLQIHGEPGLERLVPGRIQLAAILEAPVNYRFIVVWSGGPRWT